MLYPHIKKEYDAFIDECMINNEPEKAISNQDELIVLQAQILGKFPRSLQNSRELLNWLKVSGGIVHPTAIVSAFLTILGTLLARRVYTETGCSTSMYTAVVAKTGYGKDIAIKTPQKIFDIIRDPKRTVTNSKVHSLGALDDLFKSFDVVTMLYDEFGDEIGSLKNGGSGELVLKKIKELYSLTDGKYESSKYSSSGGRFKTNSFTKMRPCLSISGVTTKTQLIKNLKQDMASDGFLNRFIFLEGEGIDPIEQRQPKRDVPVNITDHMANIINGLIDHFSNTGKDRLTIPMTKEAEDYYYDFIGTSISQNSDIYNFCQNGNIDINTEVSARWRENALRLGTAVSVYEVQASTINPISVYKFDDIKVTKEVLEWAYTFIKMANIEFYSTFFDEIGKNAWEQYVNAASEWFEGQYNKDSSLWLDRTTITSNCRAFRQQKGKTEKNKLFDELIDLQKIKEKLGANKKHIYQFNKK